MSKKSFKDYLDADKVKETELVEEVTVKAAKVEEPVVQRPSPTMTVLDNTAINETLTEQRAETMKLLETVMESNATLVATSEKIMESNLTGTLALVEAIEALTSKVELLETKLDAIRDLEIPTPIVNLAMPNKQVEKTIHRDKKGAITHITESEVFDEDEDE